MSNDTDAPAQERPTSDFTSQPWSVIIGIRQATDPANPSNLTEGLLFGMAVDGSAMVNTKHGPRPDMTNEAVHFAGWFERNKEHIAALWRTEFVQYMNLKHLTDRGIPGLRIVGADEQPQLVGADGKALQ